MNQHEPLLILASGSPRRRELLSLLNLPFDVRPSDADERTPEDWEPEKIVTELALRKARVVIDDRESEGAIVIGSDTIVVLEGQVLGKPADAEEAAAMLRLLSGRRHQVYTGLACIQHPEHPERTLVGYSRADVTMRPIAETEIAAYVATGEPMDKAGSYAVQGLGAVFVERIEGDYHAIVGLPLALLYTMLARLGVKTLA
ncbi:septum formation protein Maf [Saccharibacillus sp. O16]|nr:septum formation protein Maf [Saccharibacillus sp. O16]